MGSMIRQIMAYSFPDALLEYLQVLDIFIIFPKKLIHHDYF